MSKPKSTKSAATKPAKPKARTDADDLLALFGVAALDVDVERRQAALNVIIRAALASVAQSKAEAACERTNAATSQAQMARVGSKANDAQRETCAAGVALAGALRAMRRGK